MTDIRDRSQQTPTDAVGRLVGLAGPRPALPPERAARIRAAIYPQWLGEVRGSRQRRARRWLYAAAAMLALVVGWQLWPTADLTFPDGTMAELVTATGEVRRPATDGDAEPRIELGERLRPGEEIETVGEGLAALRLANGSSVRLDAATRLQLISPTELLLAEGAVYVDSGSEAGSAPSLSIRTAHGVVQEIGTQFEVRLRGDDLRVRVREGAVTVDSADGRYAGAANEEITLDGLGQVTRARIERWHPDWSWVVEVAPREGFDGASLESYLDWVARETGWTVRYADEAIAASARTTEVHGPLADAPPDQGLPDVLAACDLTYRLEHGVLMVDDPAGTGRPS